MYYHIVPSKEQNAKVFLTWSILQKCSFEGTFLLSADIKTEGAFLTNSKKMNTKTYQICFSVHFFTVFAL